jgi:hypothetical protein
MICHVYYCNHDKFDKLSNDIYVAACIFKISHMDIITSIKVVFLNLLEL